ncbi:YcdB/YcdC domain-containing protein [Sporosarcina sp. E16_8]|uniref:YcdB/YcdC domain-containing protein n=1 Tax=Sporosarcina sp. E16_8 TaxID=2789295 RepID=UPI001A926A9B|nr:YcdB/YcdC domain-containing protein [Sporosarcina sp. E16_8]MBO0586376.1 S-layer homology domain-containing protein [Sporosarcina sp. E16_8]
MIILKKIGIVLSSSALSFGMYASVTSASITENGQPEKVQIQVASTDTVFSKNELIKKFREAFPKRFDFLTDSDFQVGGSHFFPDDKQLRHDLSFTKTINGKRLYGNVGFVGEDLEIEHFYYQPSNTAEALFPAKTSKEQARKIAVDFVKELDGGKEYQLESDPFNYFPKQILTEPVRYSFSFARTENQVTILDQRIEVSVLGNGEIITLYRNPSNSDTSTFDDVKKIKDKNEMLEKVKGNLSAELRYQIDYDYQTDDRQVQLVYQPTTKLRGVHASTGKWLTANGYSADFPVKTKIEKITANPLPPKQDGITLEDAKKIAEQFLEINSDKVKLSIQSVDEIENYNGQAVISIQYMYNFASSGHGTTMEINKNTGEIIQYNDLKSQIAEQIGEKPYIENTLSNREALAKAVKYAKEWAPSYLHNFAMPIDEAYIEERQGIYHFTFPRIENDIVVMGDQISVGVAADGSLNSFNVNYQEIEQWPSTDKVVSEEDAKSALKKALSLKLTYMKQEKNEDKNHYDLVYLPEFYEEPFSYLNANTGEWNSSFQGGKLAVISHPWAEKELNYFISAKVLDIKDGKDFNGDASVSKGEAIKIIMNSLTYIYDGRYYSGNENKNQTFDNIDPKHPLYQAIERAVEMDIIQPDGQTFDVDSPIKREELAVWYIRVLGLEQAAKDSSIYKIDFADANKVRTEYIGHVALANSMGLLKTEQNHFNPDREATYAELAVSIIRLAHKMTEKAPGLGY